jgi:transposase-like protein
MDQTQKKKTAEPYSPEFRERAVRLVIEHRDEYQSEAAALTAIAGKLGCSADSLRVWARQDRKHPLRQRTPHWNDLRPHPAKTGTDSHVARREAVLASVIYPASTVLIFVCLLSSTPPKMECCDDRLNPPYDP